MNITTWDPFKEFNQYVNRHAYVKAPAKVINAANKAAWEPKVNIHESDTQYLVSAELPGIEKEDVTVSIEQGILTIKGEKKLLEAAEDEKWHRVESVYGKFTRRFTLPDEVEADRVEANYKNGVLTLNIPKAEKAKPKLIDVKIH